MSFSHLLAEAQKLQQQLVSWRREFHMHPELGFQEHVTSSIVEQHVRKLGLEVMTNIGGTGVVAILRGKQRGPVIGLRADMDALPIQEENNHAYRSKINGVAHLCGHDGHTSMLMGAAQLLTELGPPERGSIAFVFQPAEEGLAGADAMLKDGLLEKTGISAMAALHVNPSRPTGNISITKGVTGASTDTIELKIIGQGGHAARPHESVDAIAVAAQVITALQQIPSRLVDPLETAVVTIGKIEGGFMENVIAPEVTMRGTIRTLNANVRDKIPQLLHQVIGGVTSAFGASYELIVHRGYPPVVNHPYMVEMIAEASDQLFGDRQWEEGKPSTGGEDFAFYCEKVPAAMFRLGVSNGQSETMYPLHHPRFDMDEHALPIGVAMLSAIALLYLQQQKTT